MRNPGSRGQGHKQTNKRTGGLKLLRAGTTREIHKRQNRCLAFSLRTESDQFLRPGPSPSSHAVVYAIGQRNLSSVQDLVVPFDRPDGGQNPRAHIPYPSADRRLGKQATALKNGGSNFEYGSPNPLPELNSKPLCLLLY